MPADQTLARARAELAAGRADRARSRLHGLVSTYPHRLDVREALAEAHRADGDQVQAGRWSYLSAARNPMEVAAFLAAYPGAHQRVRAMRWAGPEDLAGPVVQARLVELRTAAEEATGGPVTWSTARPRSAPGPAPASSRVADAAFAAGCFLTLAAVGALVVIGAVTVVRWIW
ncbi:DUF6584 family protein [Klenkia brasiliensis]|uniref:Tetratricopeptide repeat-containing protein n=1 Tax=Klenkia brasiliensis TaxID=333142 RepID=A0A1G7V618_9ACTN|nr:DUF6584 family protein [Klenkia brasiliensis]SDG55167.1 hypothetical protein SAMN05660324_2930 [Klenkia brasiliensis]